LKLDSSSEPKQLIIQLQAFNQAFNLILDNQQHNLFHPNYKDVDIYNDGSIKINNNNNNKIKTFCYYHGIVKNIPNSRVVANTCSG